MRALAIACGLLILPGCLCVGATDNFNEVPAQGASSGEFSPELQFRSRRRSFYLPFLRLDRETVPHDLAVITQDRNADLNETFQEFVIESLEIQYRGEATIAIISPSDPVRKRTHAVGSGKTDWIHKRPFVLLRKAVECRTPFTATMTGFAIRADGERAPFTRTVGYRYDGRKWDVWTIAEEWAAC